MLITGVIHRYLRGYEGIDKSMKNLLFILFFSILPVYMLASSSDNVEVLVGKVSYISSQNIYVKFNSTEGIEIGDTLFLKNKNNYEPAIKVEHKSSNSCAGISITNKKLEVNSSLYTFVKIILEEKVEQTADTTLTMNVPAPIPIMQSEEIVTKTSLEPLPTLNGKVSVQSYSNFSNNQTAYDYQRWRYTFQLDVGRIGGSGFSYSHYINFAYRADEWGTISDDLFNALRIYDLAIKYNFNDRTFTWLGRHLNNKISNISSIDGLQFETGIDEWSFGAAVGTRPDFDNMKFNSKLFEYGLYVNRADVIGFGDMQNTLGYFEQTNDFKTDRRFIYLQHSNSAIENTRIFISAEADLYKKEMGERKNEFSLTSLYSSINVRPSDFFSISLSYDARKNIIYYETFKTFVDSIIENETRQGFRTRITIKPVRSLFIGGDYGYRYRKGDIRPSNNYGGYITYSRIPFVETSATISFNRLRSSYIEGNIWSANLNKPIVYGIDVMLGYRYTNYKFRSGIEDLNQNSVSLNLNTYLLKPFLFNFTYEGIFEKTRTSGRFLANITYRF